MAVIRKRKLVKKTRAAVPILKNAVKSCLAPDGGKVLVITDVGDNGNFVAPIIGAGYHLAARELGLRSDLVSQVPKTSLDEIDPKVEAKMASLGEGDIMVLCVSNKLGEMKSIGKSFRSFARGRGMKFVSATSLGAIGMGHLPTFMDAINIDYGALRRKQSMAKATLDAARDIHITTKAGTDVWMKARRNKSISNDGDYKLPGQGGNLPCGEVYLPPVEHRTEGTIVIDGSSRNEFGTWPIKVPIKLTIEKGRAIHIEGGTEAKLLESGILLAEERSKYPARVRFVSELGIGFNPNARLIGSMIVDEKTKGTCHFAIGSNYWFGGKNRTIIHLDQVVKNPRIEVDGYVLATGRCRKD